MDEMSMTAHEKVMLDVAGLLKEIDGLKKENAALKEALKKEQCAHKDTLVDLAQAIN